MPLEASVIIPTYDDWHVLQGCLDCLAGQTVALDRFEVIIANNNPTSDIPADLLLPANARVIHVAKPGSYAARNAAVQVARGDALFFTDSDCLPDRLWIENGLAALANLRPIDRIAGGIEMFPKGDTWTSVELYDRTHSIRQTLYVGLGWCATANLVIRRAAFDLVGPFNEDTFAFGDSEWGILAQQLGSRIILSQETLIRHPARGSFDALAKKARRIVGNRHQLEVMPGKSKRLLVGYLLPYGPNQGKIARDDSLSETEKLRVMWVGYRLNLVNFVELFRLRYLSATPQRS